MPIESAPMDETEILGYWSNGEIHVGAIWLDGQWHRQMDSEEWMMPTHWMPLPEPPK